MRFLVLRAYFKLIAFDFADKQSNFNVLYRKVKHYTVATESIGPDAVQRVCTAMDMACIWYRKEVLCLQRSAATACLLKQCGVNAEMVIGTQQLPFRSHAWVEVEGTVVSDKPYMREMYAVVDRC